MKLSTLLATVASYEVHGDPDVEISSISDHSAAVRPGGLFVAIKGYMVDSHDHINQAIAKGATVVVGQRPTHHVPVKACTYVRVSDSRRTLSLIAAAWYGYPAERLKVIGVTGTDGKTTTVSMIQWLLNSSGIKTGHISTVTTDTGKRSFTNSTHLTCPGALQLQSYLAEMVEHGYKCAVVEVSSHAIAQHRVAGIGFDVAVITNITQEHLEYHGTFATYRDTKAALAKGASYAILNADDASTGHIIRHMGLKEFATFGICSPADIRASDMVRISNGNQFCIATGRGHYLAKLSIPGLYNVYNALAAYKVAKLYGCADESLLNALTSFEAPLGRMNELAYGQPFRVFIDFAHTSNALKNAIVALKDLLPAGKNMILVFGCPGGRDPLKRPAMGKMAARYADKIIITADDPRQEDLASIYSDITYKLPPAVIRRRFVRIDDRALAIKVAIRQAHSDDIVLIAGKGHESTLAIGDKETPWSDARVAAAVLGRVEIQTSNGYC